MNTASTRPLLTVVIIAADDGSHEYEFNELEQSILQTEFNRQVRYIIYKYDTKTDTAVSKELTQDMLSHIYFTKTTEPEASNKGFYNPQTLTRFLKRVNEREIEKEHRYILITWGHGAGLGFFTRINDLPKEFLPPEWDKQGSKYYIKKLNAQLERNSYFYSNLGYNSEDILPLNGFTGQSLNFINTVAVSPSLKENYIQYINENSNKGISASELADIIKNSIGYADMLICMNCFLQMVETGYFLSSAVNTLVAGQKVIPFAGYNYKMLFGLLNKNPMAGNKAISENITVYFPVKYHEKPYMFVDESENVREFDINLVHLSSNNLTEYIQILKNIGDLVTYLLSLANETELFKLLLGQVINPARERCQDLTLKMVDVVDLSSFLQYVSIYAKVLNRHNVKKKIMLIVRQFSSSKNKAIYSAYCPVINFEETDDPRYTFFSPKSLSVFFPNNSSEIIKNFKKVLFAGPSASTYFQHTRWDSFLAGIQ